MPISDTLKNDIRVRDRLLRKNQLTEEEATRQDAALLDVEDKAVVLELKAARATERIGARHRRSAHLASRSGRASRADPSLRGRGRGGGDPRSEGQAEGSGRPRR